MQGTFLAVCQLSCLIHCYLLVVGESLCPLHIGKADTINSVICEGLACMCRAGHIDSTLVPGGRKQAGG